MNELLFFVMTAGVVGLTYHLGFKSGLDKSSKDEIRQFLHEVTVSKMAHDFFMQRAKNETRLFLKALGAGDISVKKIRTPKLPTPEDIDKLNH